MEALCSQGSLQCVPFFLPCDVVFPSKSFDSHFRFWLKNLPLGLHARGKKMGARLVGKSTCDGTAAIGRRSRFVTRDKSTTFETLLKQLNLQSPLN